MDEAIGRSIYKVNIKWKSFSCKVNFNLPQINLISSYLYSDIKYV